MLLSAVFNATEGGSYVFVQNGERWEQRTVEIGINNLQHIQIKSGLAVDDVIRLSRPREFRNDD